MAIDVESDYLPRALLTRQFSAAAAATAVPAPAPEPEPASTPVPASAQDPGPVPSPAPEPARAQAQKSERELGRLAGQAFAHLRLEPQGYRRIEIQYAPFAGFDLAYAKGDDEVALIDTVAAEQTLDGFHDASGALLPAGTRGYVLAVIENMRKTRPDVAGLIARALHGRRLRYYEVRQPIGPSGALGDIQVREFSL